MIVLVFLSAAGVEVIPPQYEAVQGFYSTGLAWVKKNGLWGLIDINNKVMVKFQYDHIRPDTRHMFYVEKNGKTGYTDARGKVLIQPVYDTFHSFRYGLAIVEKNGKWGVINRHNEVVIAIAYTNIEEGSEFGIYSKKERQVWFDWIPLGKRLTKFEYDDIDRFSDGLAKVKKDGRFGLIYANGKLALPSELR